MKYKHILAVLITGLLILVYGSWKKIVHKPDADITITAGFVTLAVSGVLALIKILFLDKKDDFLNR